MIDRFSLWAQALDNRSPDHFDVSGRELLETDSVERERAVSCVSHVVKSGVRIHAAAGVFLTTNRTHFVLEVPSSERDQYDRIAPIICYGEHAQTDTDTTAAAAALAVDDFAHRIGRTISPEHLDAARLSFVALKKKARHDSARTSRWHTRIRHRSYVRAILASFKAIVSKQG